MYKTKYFSEIDCSNLQEKLLVSADIFRELLKVPFNVTAGYALDGHSPNSTHKTGRALDGYSIVCLLGMFICAYQAGFNGIGLYPKTDFNEDYIHIDVRELKDGELRQIWIGINKEDGTIEYYYYGEKLFNKLFNDLIVNSFNVIN